MTPEELLAEGPFEVYGVSEVDIASETGHVATAENPGIAEALLKILNDDRDALVSRPE